MSSSKLSNALVWMRRLSSFAQAGGIIAYAGVQWLVLLRILSVGGYSMAGSYALAQAVVAPAIGFFAFSMRPLWVSGALGDISPGRILAIRISTGTLGLGMAIVIESVIGMGLGYSIFGYVLAAKFLDTLSDILAGSFDRQRRSSQAGFLLIAKSVFLGFALACSWTMGLGLVATFISLLALQVCIVLVEWRLSGAGIPSGLFALRQWLTVLPLVTALAAAFNSLVASLSGFLPRYLLELFSDREAVGYFSVVFIPVMMVQMIATGLSQTHLHQLSQTTRRGRLRDSLLTSAPVAMLLVAIQLGMTALSLGAASLAGWGWESQRQLLIDASIVLVMSLPLTLRQFYSYLATSMGKMGSIFSISVVILAAQLALAPWTIRTNGIFGCVGLMSAAALVQIGAYFWLLHDPQRSEERGGPIEVRS